jgi:hypothetical protein
METSSDLKQQFIGNFPVLILAGGAVFLAWRILKGAGQTADQVAQALQLKKADAQVKAEKQAQEAIDQYASEALAKQKQSQPNGYWAMLAERIYRDTRFAAGDNHADALYCMTLCANNADFALLYKYYGKRQETWFGFIPDGGPKDLAQTISSNLSSKQKKALNDNYAKKGISIRFL